MYHNISYIVFRRKNIKFNRINYYFVDTKIELNLSIIQLFINYGVQLRTLPLLKKLLVPGLKPNFGQTFLRDLWILSLNRD